MDLVTLLIIISAVIAWVVILIMGLTIAWLKAEKKAFLLGGKSKWFVWKKRKKGDNK